MAFTSAVLEESKKLGSGEVLRTRPFNVEAFSTFEDGLVMGRFAKHDTDSVDNLDNKYSYKSPFVSLPFISILSNEVTTICKTIGVGIKNIASSIYFA